MIHDCNLDFLDVEIEDYCNNKEFLKFYEDFDKFKTIKIYIYMIFTFVHEIIIWYIIYFFSPNHYIAISSIESFFISLITLQKQVNRPAIYFLASLLIVFFIMVYNEMIILNFCGLGRDTKAQIADRAKDENLDSILNEEEEEEGENQKVEIENYQVDMNN